MGLILVSMERGCPYLYVTLVVYLGYMTFGRYVLGKPSGEQGLMIYKGKKKKKNFVLYSDHH